MAKKARKHQNMDAVLRIKHLYRAAEYLAKLPITRAASLQSEGVNEACPSDKGFVESDSDHPSDGPRPKKTYAVLELSQKYTKIMKGVASKAVVRLYPRGLP